MPRKTSSPLLLVTRPEPSASETARALRAEGYTALVSPALVATSLPPRDLQLARSEQLIVTSPQAARFLESWTQLHALPVWAVGRRTAALLRASGFKQVIYDDNETAASLATALAISKGLHFCILSAPSTGRALQKLLQVQGKRVRRAPVYRISDAPQLSPAAARALADHAVTHVLIYSARTARSFMRLAADQDLQTVTALCLSTAVAAGLQDAAFKAIRIAERPTAEALQALLPALD